MRSGRLLFNAPPKWLAVVVVLFIAGAFAEEPTEPHPEEGPHSSTIQHMMQNSKILSLSPSPIVASTSSVPQPHVDLSKTNVLVQNNSSVYSVVNYPRTVNNSYASTSASIDVQASVNVQSNPATHDLSVYLQTSTSDQSSVGTNSTLSPHKQQTVSIIQSNTTTHVTSSLNSGGVILATSLINLANVSSVRSIIESPSSRLSNSDFVSRSILNTNDVTTTHLNNTSKTESMPSVSMRNTIHPSVNATKSGYSTVSNIQSQTMATSVMNIFPSGSASEGGSYTSYNTTPTPFPTTHSQSGSITRTNFTTSQQVTTNQTSREMTGSSLHLLPTSDVIQTATAVLSNVSIGYTTTQQVHTNKTSTEISGSTFPLPSLPASGISAPSTIKLSNASVSPTITQQAQMNTSSIQIITSSYQMTSLRISGMATPSTMVLGNVSVSHTKQSSSVELGSVLIQSSASSIICRNCTSSNITASASMMSTVVTTSAPVFMASTQGMSYSTPALSSVQSASLVKSMVSLGSSQATPSVSRTVSIISSSSVGGEAPTASPQNVVAHSLSSTSIYVSWQPPPKGTLNGILHHYEVFVNKASTPTTPTPTVTKTHYLSKAATKSSLVGLITSVVSSRGVTQLHMTSSFQGVMTSSLIPLPPIEPTGEPTEPPESAVMLPIDAGLSLNLTVTHLEIWTLYEVSVRAVTTKPGPLSAPVTVRTEEDVPTAPLHLSIQSSNSSSLSVTWDVPSKSNGILLGYRVSYKANGSSMAMRTNVSLERHYTITKLLPFTLYIVQVAAYTIAGQGEHASLTYQTSEGRPSSPRNVTSLSLNSSAIQLTWSRPQSPNGHIKYLLYVRPASGDQSEETLIYEGLDTNYEAGGLAAYTEYVFTVYSSNTQDSHLISEPVAVTAKTRPGVPSGSPLDVRVLTKSSSSALVCWNPPHMSDWNGPIVHYTVEFYTNNGPHNLTSTPDNNTCLLVTSLRPYTTYYFMVKMVNTAGIGPGSEVVSNMTLEDAPSPPTKVRAITTSSTSIRLEWARPLHPNGAIIKYKLFYHLSSDGSSANKLAYDGEDTKFLVNQLEEFLDYTFTLIAYNDKIDKSSDPVMVYQSTHPAAPTAPPQNVTAIAASSSSIRISWQPPVASEINGKLLGYLVTFNGSGGSENVTALFSNQTDLLITKLRAYIVYYVTVRAKNGIGAGPASDFIYCRTMEDSPGPPVFDEVRNLNSTVLFVSWLRPVNSNGVITRYKVCCALEGSPGIPSCTTTNGTVKSINVTSLVPYSSYVISLTASTSVGYGPVVSGVYRTDEGVPTRPLNLSAWNTSSDSIYVSWSAPHKINGMLTKYQVSYTRNGSSQVIRVKSIGLSTNLTSLDVYTVYNIHVSACTRKGCGDEATTAASTGEGVPAAVSSVTVTYVGVSTLQVTWSPPSKPNGKIGYYVDFWQTHHGSSQQRRIVVPDGALIQTVGSLEPYMNYTVSIVAYNVRSSLEGPGSTVYVRTLPAAPEGPPTAIKLSQATASSLTITWGPPDKPNGAVERYRVMFYDTQKPSNKERHWTTTSEYTLDGLSPWNEYSVQIACESSGGLGPYSRVKTFRTSPSEPPTIPTLKPPGKSDVSAHEIVMELAQASDANGQISYYQVVVLELHTDSDGLPIHPAFTPDHYKPEDLVDYNEADALKPKLVPYITGEFQASEFVANRKFVVGRGNDSTVRTRRDTGKDYFNGPLTAGTFYTVFQRAYVSKELYTSGAWIEPVSTADASTPASRRKSSDSSSGLIVGLSVTFAGLIVILIVVVAFVWRKRRFDFGVMLDDNGDYSSGRSLKLKKLRRRRTSSKGLMGSTDSLDALEELSRNRNRRQPIPVEHFATHVRQMHTDGDIGFSEEYELVQPNDEGFTWQHSLHSANKYKNRYANIIAYDHSRVLLIPMEGVQESEYINANYIDGYNRSGAYIASQGPLPETFDDFWRMVWEQGSATIVMLTQLEERGRRKCDQYWPDRGTHNYGHIRVTANETFRMSYYILRTFMLSHMQVEEEEPRQVRQYHFTSWPDHGVPSHPTPLLSMVRTVSQANPSTAGPMIVHCSAGVGRTGTFITLDSMLQRIAQEGTIDIYGFVRQMRNKRNLMVQTESQYVFIHDALVEAVACGVTEVEANKLMSRIRELREVDPNLGITYMDKEFQRLKQDERHPSTFKNANLGCNALKNRYANILPYERTRVPLKMRPGEVGSDYINANFIDGNFRLNAYIATQAPVPNTFEDFWRMTWEHGSSVIVMLTREEEAGKLKCHRYWPSDGSRLYDKILVELTEELTYSDYVVRHFNVTHTEEKSSRTIRQFQYTDWPDVGLPESGVGIIDLIGQVEKWQQQSGNTCITVHCSGGVGRTGVFCAVSILIDRVKAEGLIDVFQTVQHLRLQRPAMVQTKDQYEFCYTTMEEYLASFDLYANFQ